MGSSHLPSEAKDASQDASQQSESLNRLEGLQSVLLHLEEKAGAMPRVMLHDLPSEGAPVVKGRGQGARAETTAFHQYQIHGEVARGGVGIVYKARDFDIGRDVAMKMLKDELAEDPARVQRFLEEAQIAGQLQHPGILPVYAVGLRNRETPYFTMKFIKGGTLAAVLQNRGGPTDERTRLLEIFGHVAKAMAYAHARGVVHRDLKPANVLVGAYGEVQVMDWGMAKVLERGGVADERRSRQSQESVISVIEPLRTGDAGSESIAGSVMGTPAYMAPEQAQGQVGLTDTRTDVFALGGILCEILTGFPPYRPNAEHSVFAQAARCMLQDAYDRLDACEADVRLIALTKSCLLPAPPARPHDAGVLSRELDAYARAVDVRARKAQLDAVKAQERERAAEVRARASKRHAEDERRAKRVTMGLAATVLGIVILGVGGWISVQADERQRAAATQAAVSSHLDEALARLADAQASPAATAVWREARAAAQKADAAAKAGEASPATTLRVTSVLDRIKTGEAEALAQAALRAREAALVAELEDLVSRKGPEFDPAVLEAGYARAYREYGLGVDDEDSALLVRAIRDSAIHEDLIAGLDEWAWLRARYALGPETSRDRPADLARLADRDATRNSVRKAAYMGSQQRLQRLAKAADIESMPLGILHLLATALDDSGDRGGAVGLLRRVVALHPADFWSNLHLAYWLAGMDDPDWEQAVRYYTAAVALRPQSARVLNNLGIALQESKQVEDAIDAYLRALAIDPALAIAWNNLGTAYIDQELFEKAVGAFDEAIQRNAQAATAYYGKGNALLKMEDAPGAILAFRKALEIQGDFPRARQQLFAALAADGQSAEAVQLAEAALEEGETSWAYCQLAHARLRRGDFDGAVLAFKAAIERGDEDGVATHDLGSAYARLGMWDHARDHYAKAVDLAPGDAQFRFDLGYAEKMWGAWRQALRLFQETLDLDANYAPAYDERGELFMWMGRLREAESEILRAVELEPTARYGHSHLGQLYGRNRTVDDAIARYEEHVPNPGLDSRAAFFGGLSYAQYQRGLLEGATRAIRSALRALPSAQGYHERLGLILGYQLPFAAAVRRYEATAPGRTDKTEAYFYNGLGQSYTQRGCLADAAQAYQGAHDRSPENAAPLLNLSHTLDLRVEEERSLALDYLQNSLRISPFYLNAHRRLGFILGQTMAREMAESAYRTRVAEAPDTCRAYFLLGLGQALNARGDVSAALDAWDEAMTLNQMAAATCLAAKANACYYEHDDVARARDLYVQALRLAPRYPNASMSLGVLLGMERAPDDAIAAYEELVPRRPGINEASFLVGLASSQEEQGRLDVALRLVNQALDLQPELGTAHAQHVHTLIEQGRLDEAVHVATQYLVASPYATNVRTQLARAHDLAGDRAAYEKELDAALKHAASASGLLVMRGRLLESDGRWDEAWEVYQRAARFAATARTWVGRPHLEQALERSRRLAPHTRNAKAIAARGDRVPDLETLDLAHLCLRCGASARAAEHFREALRGVDVATLNGTDETLRTAASAALSAGLARGHDARRLGAKERKAWRECAALWLRMERDRLCALRQSANSRTRAIATMGLRGALLDPAFASVRDMAALAHLPVEEADDWRALWAEIRRSSGPLANPE